MAITWNPSDKSAKITLSNGNLTLTKTVSTGYSCVRATSFKSSGKWYFEVRSDTQSGTFTLGIATTGANLNQKVGYGAYGYGYASNGQKSYNGSSGNYGATFSAGDIIRVAFDMDAGKVWFAKNNSWQASGDPVAGTNEAYSGISGLFTGMAGFTGLNDAGTARFSSASFTYTPPSGFLSLEYVPPPMYYFSGYVFDDSIPASGIVINAHNRVTGALVTTTTSSGNGYYYMETASSGSHYLVCLDDVAGEDYNDLIIGSAFPTEIT